MVFLCISKAGFLVIIILHLCCLVSSKPQFVGVFCSNRSGLYASNSPYQSNLSLIFSNLTTAANLRGFYNTTAGEGLDKVYALFYCRGDLNSSDCHNCVKTASSRIIDECQTEKEAIIFFEECTLRYANRLIFSLKEEDPNDWSYSDTYVSDKDGFNQILTTATGGPMNQAAFNSSFKGFATGVTKLSVNQTLYSLVQCTPDILGSPCQKCLAAALDNLLYEGKTRMGLFMPSCVVIYSLTPFFKSGNTSVSSPFYPIAESPENAPFSQVSRTKSKSKVPIAVVVAVPVAGLGLVLLLFVLWFCFHQRKARWGFKAGEAQHLKLSSNKLGRTFKYKELELATDKFSSANLLGQGGFGYVHKGVLPNGKEIAVKQLKSGSLQGEREFQAEVETISGIHHRHLVSLVGCCISGDRRLLVYELIPNKTLEFHLHGEGRPPMSWESRLRIALGAAKGLAYLHEDCQPKIIHRDIKAANILLDNEFEVKVADFGLAKFSYDAETHVSTRVMGTFGYLAPEYALSGKLTEKSDVFSYGIVLLELITGRRPLHNAWPFTGVDLIEWSGPLLVQALQSGDCKALIDPRLENYDSSKIAQMITCAALCVRNSARERPKMSQIVRVLEGNMSGEDLMKELASGDMLLQKASDHDFINHFASDSQAHTTSEWSELSTIEHVVSQSNSSTENHDGIQQSKTDNSVH